MSVAPMFEDIAYVGAKISFHDPSVIKRAVEGEQVPRAVDVHTATSQADRALLLQDHSHYDLDKISLSP